MWAKNEHIVLGKREILLKVFIFFNHPKPLTNHKIDFYGGNSEVAQLTGDLGGTKKSFHKVGQNRTFCGGNLKP